MGTAIIPQRAIAGDGKAAELAGVFEERVEGLRDITRRLADFLAQWRAMPDSGRRAAGTQPALGELDQLQGGAESIQQALMLEIESALRAGVPSPGSASDAIIDENLADAWATARRELDQAVDVTNMKATIERIAQAATDHADSTMLSALRGELPGYLALRRMDALITWARPRIDEIEAPRLTPPMRVAALARAALETGWPRVLAAFDVVRGEVNGGPAVAVLPSFDGELPIPPVSTLGR